MVDKPLLEEAFRTPSFVTDQTDDEGFEDSKTQPELEEPVHDDTYGLLYVGHLTDIVKIGQHEVRIRTLKIGEELNAALLANRYKDTVEEGRALATALVAAAIDTVDGKPLLGELIGPGDNAIEAKFDYILRNWYWESARQVWDAYNALLQRVQQAGEELKKD